MTFRILIPFRGPESGKSRLRGVLSEPQRQHLAMAMFAHVLTKAAAAVGPECVMIATASVMAADAASAAGAGVFPDNASSLNDVLGDACAHLSSRGSGRLTILAADLPLLTSDDVAAMLEAGRGRVAIAPDRHGRGTNALTVPLGVGFGFVFGSDSYAAHRREAERLRFDVLPVMRPGLACDIDEAADLALVPTGSGFGDETQRPSPVRLGAA